MQHLVPIGTTPPVLATPSPALDATLPVLATTVQVFATTVQVFATTVPCSPQPALLHHYLAAVVKSQQRMW